MLIAYVSSGVPAGWIVALVDLVLEGHRAPFAAGYLGKDRGAPGELLVPGALSGLAAETAALQ